MASGISPQQLTATVFPSASLTATFQPQPATTFQPTATFQPQTTASASYNGFCDLSVDKSMSPNPLVSGQSATVTITVRNIGTTPCILGAPASPVKVKDPTPAGMMFTAAPTSSDPSLWTCQLKAAGAVCSTGLAGSLPAGYSMTMTISATVTGAAGSTVYNCATAQYSDYPSYQYCATSQVVSPTSTPTGCALSITKTADPSSVQEGGTVTFTVTVTNTGTSPCGNMAAYTAPTTVTDTLPSGFSNPTGSGIGWTCKTTLSTVTCKSYFIGPNSSSTISITATASAAGSYLNCANFSFGVNPPQTGSDCASVTVTTVTTTSALCDLVFNKTITYNGMQDPPTTISVASGTVVTVTVSVTNFASVPCAQESGNGWVIQDKPVAGMSAPGADSPGISYTGGWSSSDCGVYGGTWECNVIPALTPGQSASASWPATVSGSGGATVNNCINLFSGSTPTFTFSIAGTGCAQVTVTSSWTTAPQVRQGPIAGGISNTCSYEYVLAGVTYPCSTAPATFSAVSKGDVIVVALDTYADLLYPTTTNSWNSVKITDSLGSSYIQAIGKCGSQFTWGTSSGLNRCSAIYYATVPSSGKDTVTVYLNSAPQTAANDIVFDFYMFDVSGITIPTTSQPCTASGSSMTSTIETTSSSIGTTSCPTSGYFLIATFGTEGTDTPTNCQKLPCSPADGFTYLFPGDKYNFSIYSTSGVVPAATTTTFPATIPTADNWIEVAAAFTC